MNIKSQTAYTSGAVKIKDMKGSNENQGHKGHHVPKEDIAKACWSELEVEVEIGSTVFLGQL